jgi:cation transport regulator ChaC
MDRVHWIFGYGSLVWRPAFRYGERRPAFVEGLARRFWQGSTDHRGVPGAPGRVVTLVPQPRARCWGMAYRVEAAERDAVMAALDHREQGGYERCEVRLRMAGAGGPGDLEEAVGITYRATPDNPNYLGEAPLEAIARQVRAARGPSGTNREYVLRLAGTLRALGADDAHVFALAALLEADDGG